MKKGFLLAGMLVVLIGLTPLSALAFEAEGTAYFGLFDKYLWRGFDLSGGLPVAQGGVDVGLGGVTLSYWSSLQLSRSAGDGLAAGNISETDLTVDYSRPLTERVSLSVGNIFYALDGLEDTNEFYLGLSLDSVASPSLTVYYDWDQAKENGLFYVLAFEHRFQPWKKLRLTPSLAVSYNDKSDYSIGDYSDWHDVEAGLRVDYELSGSLAVSATFLASSGLSDAARKALDSETQGGISMTFAF